MAEAEVNLVLDCISCQSLLYSLCVMDVHGVRGHVCVVMTLALNFDLGNESVWRVLGGVASVDPSASRDK